MKKTVKLKIMMIIRETKKMTQTMVKIRNIKTKITEMKVKQAYVMITGTYRAQVKMTQ